MGLSLPWAPAPAPVLPPHHPSLCCIDAHEQWVPHTSGGSEERGSINSGTSGCVKVSTGACR